MVDAVEIPPEIREAPEAFRVVLHYVEKDAGIEVQHSSQIQMMEFIRSIDKNHFPRTRKFLSFIQNNAAVLDSNRRSRQSGLRRKKTLKAIRLAEDTVEELEENISVLLWDREGRANGKDLEAVDSLLFESLGGIRYLFEYLEGNPSRDFDENVVEFVDYCLDSYTLGLVKWKSLYEDDINSEERNEIYNRISRISRWKTDLNLGADSQLLMDEHSGVEIG